ncbi:MAG: FAD-dependent oxidoreductase [Microgenomates group bacterium]
MKIAIIGGGIGALTTAFCLSKKNQKVFLFEKEKRLGGLASGLKEKNWQWHLDCLFHHLFTSDKEAISLIEEIGLKNSLFFSRPKTAIFYEGKISQFDSPLSLLTFPHLNFVEKIRAGLVTFYLKLNNNWQNLEKIEATKWLEKFYGKRNYQILWEPLLKGKFGAQAEKISMAWFWARIKKRSTKLGYLKGGFQVLINTLEKEIKKNGGKIFLNQEIKSLKELSDFQKIIITAPTEKFFPGKFPSMLGAINLILILKKRFLTDGTYWLNINEKNFPFVAVVEHTNFIDSKYYGGNHILYVGGYYPQNHRYFKMNEPQIFKEFAPFLKKINPIFNFDSSILNLKLTKNLFAQPIVPVNYSLILKKAKKSLPKNIYLANMQTIYPYDRGVNYAIAQAKKVTQEVLAE